MDLINKIQVRGTNYAIGLPSNLSEAQKEEIRNNIGAVAKVDVDIVPDGTYPDMTVGKAISDENGDNIATTYARESEVIKTTTQTLTDSEKLQSRENINAQVAGDYALIDGTYPDLTVGKAVADSGDNNIADTYQKKSDLLNKTYPIGAIYLSYTVTSPASLFGGTWTRIEGRFLLGASSTYTAGSTGGEAAQTLTVDEMPTHGHLVPFAPSSAKANGSEGFYTVGKRSESNWASTMTEGAGGGKSHNNMPPYLAVYIWRRTA